MHNPLINFGILINHPFQALLISYSHHVCDENRPESYYSMCILGLFCFNIIPTTTFGKTLTCSIVKGDFRFIVIHQNVLHFPLRTKVFHKNNWDLIRDLVCVCIQILVWYPKHTKVFIYSYDLIFYVTYYL